MKKIFNIKLLFVFFIFMIFGSSSGFALVRIYGNAKLENQSVHTGIKVVLRAKSPSAKSDSTYTNSAGNYEIKQLNEGVYDAIYSYTGYKTHTIYSQGIFVETRLPNVTLKKGSEISGKLKGTLTKSGNPYEVTGEIWISWGDTLKIEPGVIIKFKGFYKLYVKGVLKCLGSSSENVLFTSGQTTQTTGDWNCIVFYGAQSGSQVNYTKIQYAVTGIIIWDTVNPAIDNTIVELCLNGAGIIKPGSKPALNNVTIKNNLYNGIVIQEYAGPTLNSCNIKKNLGNGILVLKSSVPTIANCNADSNSSYGISFNAAGGNVTQSFMRWNSNGGIYCYSGSPSIIGNTIGNNYSNGIYIENATPVIEDVIITNNEKSGIFCDMGAPRIRHSNISNNADAGVIFSDRASGLLDSCSITNNLIGVQCEFEANPEISGNTVMSNLSHGINCFWNGSPYILENIIRQNSGDGIYSFFSQPNIVRNIIFINKNGIRCSDNTSIYNNTLVGNSLNGIHLFQPSSARLKNNTIYYSSGTGIYAEYGCNLTVAYNNSFLNTKGQFGGNGIPLHVGELTTVNANGDSSDIFYNIMMDPKFKNPSAYDFSLKNTSPNIDAGDPTFEPPELGGDIIDIGALELLYEEPVYNPEIKINPEKFDISILPDVSKDTTLVISNTGEDTLLFRIRDDAVWLTETPTSGNILEGYSKNIKVSIKGAGLLIGNYTGKMTILSNDPENDTLRVPVNLTVLPYVDLKLETAQTWVPRGGTLDYSQILTNLTTKTQNFIQWFTVNKQGGPVVWKSSTKNYSLTSGQVKGENFKQAVPVTAPLGFYVFNSYIGSSESYVWDTDSFAFEIRIGGQDSGR